MSNVVGIYSNNTSLLTSYTHALSNLNQSVVAVQSANSGMGGSGNDVINIGTIGEPGPPGPPGNPSPVAVTEVATAEYTALSTDYFLCVLVIAQVVITLPTGILGTVYIVKDCSGNASVASPIIIQGTAQNVDGGTATINVPYGSVTLIFNGTDWSLV